MGRPRRLPGILVDGIGPEGDTRWEAKKAKYRALREARRGPVAGSSAATIAEQYKIPAAFNLRRRINEAARDYSQNVALDAAGYVKKSEQRQARLLRTLQRRLAGARPGLVRTTLSELGVGGAVELGLYKWNGDPADVSLVEAVRTALEKRASNGKGGRRHDARWKWIHALVCIFAEAKREVPSAGRAAGKTTKGALARFVEACSKAAQIEVGPIAYSTLFRIVNSPGVAHFAAK